MYFFSNDLYMLFFAFLNSLQTCYFLIIPLNLTLQIKEILISPQDHFYQDLIIYRNVYIYPHHFFIKSWVWPD